MAKKNQKNVKKTAVVKSHALNVRKETSRNAQVIKVVHRGDKLDIVKEGKDWTQISEGFVMSQYIDVEVVELPDAASTLSEEENDD